MRRAGGFTLVELMVAGAIAALLLSVALPSFAEHWRSARRSDAVVALTRLQMAQEQHRALHGVYAVDLAALRGAASRSEHGWYDLQLHDAQPHRYEALALARADGSQAQDHACQRISLQVIDGLAENGPDLRCWNR